MPTEYGVRETDGTVPATRGDMEAWVERSIRGVVETMEDYARRNPLTFATCAFGIGFILGWRLKPW
jgi:hypothetical protein